MRLLKKKRLGLLAMISLSFAVLLILTACQAGKPYERRSLYPEKAAMVSLAELGSMVAVDPGAKKIYPDGVKVSGFVISSYQGGPLGKEILKVAAGSPTEPNLTETLVYCAREVPVGGVPVKTGDSVTVAGYVYFSSVKDTVFLAECQLLP